MSEQVVNGAQLKCSMGTAPSSLTVMPNMVKCGGQPAATIMDFVPNMNIMPFAMCQSPANPQVIAATAAAMGVLTPQPCIPMTVAPWIPGTPTVIETAMSMPALNKDCKCMCLWAGVIEITNAGQTKVKLP